ncbi:type VI secretion system lipoprotein TssJ [Erwinia psidii]|uniref:Type VI secretion system lipoprotein TssJ n=1 Tax=Erwinia psidii TaxID=69224 RepID=A0A3N6S0H5_9GAMM|nr:type VI secretion system lipoprotein TssJ [Erwinia psidii]MCX8958668.1 type VI secretion system lipoprotein TssJ [Erwinia psidii]MCX8961203.1 type VI secretion system lipoprotein TssJ [Erwinia psidii]RQM38994.1 type VI secretion system lipoprotein TssJ [Erwinia psidii]
MEKKFTHSPFTFLRYSKMQHMKKINTRAKHSIRYIMVLVFSLFLSGCGFSLPKKQESDTLKISLIAAKDINLNEKGEASPLSIAIYQLKVVDNFENSDFFSIADSTNTALKEEYSRIYEGILKPGETRKVSVSPDKEAVALGITAAYREIDKADWSEIIPLEEKDKKKSWWRKIKIMPGDTVVFSVHFNTLAISIDEAD